MWSNAVKTAFFFKKLRKIAQTPIASSSWGLAPGAYLGGAIGPWPLLWVAKIAKLHRKVSKIEACPPFARWATGFELEITWFWIWGKTFFFSALHLILGEKLDEIWEWQFQLQNYVPLKFSEVSAPPPPLFKILRTLLTGPQTPSKIRLNYSTLL